MSQQYCHLIHNLYIIVKLGVNLFILKTKLVSLDIKIHRSTTTNYKANEITTTNHHVINSNIDDATRMYATVCY